MKKASESEKLAIYANEQLGWDGVGNSKLLSVFVRGVIEQQAEQMVALQEQIRAKDDAIDKALHELGIPGPGYPSPVANAIVALKQALKGDTLMPNGKNMKCKYCGRLEKDGVIDHASTCETMAAQQFTPGSYGPYQVDKTPGGDLPGNE